VRLNEGDQPHLLLWGKLYPWTMTGYDQPMTVSDIIVNVLTPISMVKMLKAGFPLLVNREETVHPSVLCPYNSAINMNFSV